MSEPPKPSKQAILVVDDDVWNARMVSALLENAGYRAIRASDPLKALPLLRLERFSLVLLDQNMPGMDGLTLLGEIRKESEVPVVMLTGTDRADLAVRALRLGAYDYLTKPVDEQRLLQTVTQAIGSATADLDHIASYQIEREVGRGGMGVVYAARDTRLERSVALKVLLPELAANRGYEDDFLREAQVAARFSHPNIVTVYEAGRYRGRLFIAMELVQGQTLQGIIQAGPALPARRVIEIGLQVASALEAVHAAGMLHGDLKPGNIMLTSAHSIKILDFGLVRPAQSAGQESSTSTKSFSGTLSYIPPETLSKGRTDFRGDVYALGVVLYELLAGVKAFEGETEFAIMFKIVEGKVARPWTELTGVSPEGIAIVRRMMAAAPEDRFPTMAEARTALEGLLAQSV